MWVSVRVCGCVGVLVTGFFCSYMFDSVCLPACRPWVPAWVPAWVPWAPTVLIRQNSLVSSFSVRSELMVSHNASALAQESTTRIPKWKDLGPVRLPCPGQRHDLRTVSCRTRLYFIREGSCDLATDEPMAHVAIRKVRRGTVATIPAGGSFEC